MVCAPVNAYGPIHPLPSVMVFFRVQPGEADDGRGGSHGRVVEGAGFERSISSRAGAIFLHTGVQPGGVE
jgi:hypothetical protein